MDDTARILRQAIGMSQADLAQHIGTTQVTVNRWESAGTSKPDVVEQLRVWAGEIRDAVESLLEMLDRAEDQALDRGVEAEVAILRYDEEDWLAASVLEGGDFQGWPWTAHDAVIRTVVLMACIPVTVVRFDPEAYTAWLGTRADARAQRAAWAALQ